MCSRYWPRKLVKLVAKSAALENGCHRVFCWKVGLGFLVSFVVIVCLPDVSCWIASRGRKLPSSNISCGNISAFANQDSELQDSYHYQPVPCLFNTPETKTRCPSYYIDINTYDLSNFTFITGASSNHFEESKDLIASIQNQFPRKKIYYYDIGLNRSQTELIQTYCNVVYRKWNANSYPEHVRSLSSFAFKPLIIHEALLQFDAVFWLDASGRLNPEAQHANWRSVYETARVTDGIAMFDGTGGDTFRYTTAGMYRYLPVDEKKLKRFEMVGAGSLLLYRTQNVFNKIVYWWSLCAITETCIQPEGHHIDCRPSKPGVSICHRYDQSALNILVANYLSYKQKHIPRGEPVIIIRREPTDLYRLVTDCNEIHRQWT